MRHNPAGLRLRAQGQGSAVGHPFPPPGTWALTASGTSPTHKPSRAREASPIPFDRQPDHLRPTPTIVPTRQTARPSANLRVPLAAQAGPGPGVFLPAGGMGPRGGERVHWRPRSANSINRFQGSRVARSFRRGRARNNRDSDTPPAREFSWVRDLIENPVGMADKVVEKGLSGQVGGEARVSAPIVTFC